MRLVTPPITVFTNGTTAEHFIPATRGYNSTGIRDVSVGGLLVKAGSSNLSIRPAFQYSHQGIAWAAATGIGTAWTATDEGEWKFPTTQIDLEGLATPRNFVRFGFLVANDEAGAVECAQAQLSITARDLTCGTFAVTNARVNGLDDVQSGGEEMNEGAFTPLTDAMDATSIQQVRVTLERWNGVNIKIQPAFQTSVDGRNWIPDEAGKAGHTCFTFGNALTDADDDDIDYGIFSTPLVYFVKPLIRFGISAVAASGSSPLAPSCSVNMRVDWR